MNVNIIAVTLSYLKLMKISNILENVTSDKNLRETVILNLAYSLAKGALVNLTRQMSSYYSRYGIRVNNVCPGGVYDKSISKSDISYKKLVKNYSQRSPIGRMASPEEIAGPIVFLASEQSSYISGTSLVVDGGWTAI